MRSKDGPGTNSLRSLDEHDAPASDESHLLRSCLNSGDLKMGESQEYLSTESTLACRRLPCEVSVPVVTDCGDYQTLHERRNG